jgi:hypothetical protein
MAVWYNLRNNHWNDDADSWETQLGLMRTDFSKKPAYYAFKAYEPGLGPLPSPTPSAPSPTEPVPTSPSSPSSPTGTAPAADRRATRTSLSLTRRVARTRARASSRAASRQLLVAGRVIGASGGYVKIKVRRRNARGRWVHLRTHTVALNRDGKFGLRLGFRRSQRLLVRAVYPGSRTAAPSRSAARRVRT